MPTCMILSAALARPDASLGKYSRQGCVAQDGRGASSGDDAPGDGRRNRPAEDQCHLRDHRSAQRAGEHVLGFDAEPTQPVRCEAKEQAAGADGDRHDAQEMHDAGAIEPVDILEPWGGPQSLQRPGRANADRRQGRQAPEAAIAVDGPQADGLPCLWCCGQSTFGHHTQDKECRYSAECTKDSKQTAPAHRLHDELGRRGGGHGPERAQHHEPAVDEGQPLGREPQHDGFEARHQGQGDAETDQGPAHHQVRSGCRRVRTPVRRRRRAA